jgi:dihydropteroate synthase
MPGIAGEVDDARLIDCAGIPLRLDRPRIMGILNVTPDSFSDGGVYVDPDTALARARAMVEDGADIIDVGGESSRPGAAPVTVEEELARVLPVIARLREHLPGIPVSIDTCKPPVMRAAAAAGASLINDITALRADGALETAAELGLPVCLMHMQGEPRSMQQNPRYGDVVREVADFLAGRVAACVAAGIPPQRLILDPGLGFGKTVDHNLELLARLGELAVGGLPLLLGASRKSMIGTLLGRPVGERLYASIALATIAAWQGAAVLRVHDVRETADALVMCTAVKSKVKR